MVKSGGLPEVATYLDFEVLSEPWNVYALSDGSRLRIRFVLHKVGRLGDSSGKGGLRVSNGLLTVVEVPRKLRGKAGPARNTADLESLPGSKSLTWTVERQGQSAYRIGEDTFLMVETSPVEVSRTTVYGPDSDPYYVVKSMTKNQLIQPPSASTVPATSPQPVPTTSRSGSTKTRVRLPTSS